MAVEPDFDEPIVARRYEFPRRRGTPSGAIHVLRVRVVHGAHQAEASLRASGTALRLLAEYPYHVVAAGSHDEPGQLAPVNVVDGPRVISRQRADALPREPAAVLNGDALLVPRAKHLPYLHGLVVAAGGQPIAALVERQTPDCRRVRGQRRHARPIRVREVFFEHLDGVVVAGRRQQVLRGMPPDLWKRI